MSESRSGSDEESTRRIDELMKNPEKFKQAESRVEAVVENWLARS